MKRCLLVFPGHQHKRSMINNEKIEFNTNSCVFYKIHNKNREVKKPQYQEPKALTPMIVEIAEQKKQKRSIIYILNHARSKSQSKNILPNAFCNHMVQLKYI